MDRISELPDSIVHHILSFLDSRRRSAAPELLRLSLLSKKWSDLISSLPILDFTISKFTRGLHVSSQSFFKYVEYTTSRFCHQNVIAHKFKLTTTLQDPAELDLVNRCLELVLKNGVIDLEIGIINNTLSSTLKYRLPDILLSVSVLKSLTITNCELPSSLMVDAVKFESLTRLKLENILIDDDVIKYFTIVCPLLELFHIGSCLGFKTFCVYGHQNLQTVRIYYNTPIERIDIEAPNLSTLMVIDMNERGAPRMNLSSCKKLTTVTYYGHPLRNSNGFNNLLSNFPFIEDLFLVTKNKCNLKFSSHSLRKLVLHSNCDLEDIEFNTPNLVVFNYSCSHHILWPPLDKNWPLVKDFTRLKSHMKCYLYEDIDSLWFQKLRQFLEKKNGFKVMNLFIQAIRCQKFTELEKLKAIELPPYELEYVELQLDPLDKLSGHVAFVDVVLWCCRPRSLSLRSSISITGFEDVVKFTYKKLLQQEDQDHTNIQIVSHFSPSSFESQKHFTDLMSLSMALPHERKTISFIKEKVV